LTNHRDISTARKSLHERLGARLGNGTKVVNQVSLGHTDTGIPDDQTLVVLVRSNADVEVLLGVELGGVGERSITDFVEGVRAVRDEFTKEDLLV
jgi:hypothetical protein